MAHAFLRAKTAWCVLNRSRSNIQSPVRIQHAPGCRGLPFDSRGGIIGRSVEYRAFRLPSAWIPMGARDAQVRHFRLMRPSKETFPACNNRRSGGLEPVGLIGESVDEAAVYCQFVQDVPASVVPAAPSSNRARNVPVQLRKAWQRPDVAHLRFLLRLCHVLSSSVDIHCVTAIFRASACRPDAGCVR